MCERTIRAVWEQQVSARPDAECMTWIDVDNQRSVSFTYREFDKQVNQIANVLVQEYRIAKGDRVALVMGNSVHFVRWLLAVSKIGAVVVPMALTLTQSEYTFLLSSSEPELVVVCEEAQIDLPDSCQATAISTITSRAITMPDELQEQREIRESDLAQIMYTSGTTQCPKGVMLTHANFVFSGFYVNWQLAMCPEDRYFTSMLATHVNFQLSAMMPCFTIGASLVFASRYSASRFWKHVIEHRATLVQSMAMIARTMMAQPVDPHERDHSVRFVHYFLPMTRKEKEVYEERFGIELINNYGLTETLVGVITDVPYGAHRWPSIGIEGLGYEAQIRREDGTVASPNETGEIFIRGIAGHTLLAGYWNDPVATEKVLSDGWFATGDIGYQDDDGYFYFLDRANQVIKRSGENISALEVEAVLRDSTRIRDVAVVGVEDPIYDQVVKAVVVPDDESLTRQEVIDFAALNLAHFKVPEIVEFRQEIPRGLYGKVLTQQLRDEAK